MNEREDFALLPPYLTDSDGAQPEVGAYRRTYGTLSYNKRRGCWVVKGDPGVTELCKRLFQGLRAVGAARRALLRTNALSVN